MQGTPGGVTAESGSGVSQTCWSARLVNRQVARIARQRGPLSLKDAETLCEKLTASSAAGCRKCTPREGVLFNAWSVFGVLPEEYMSKSDDELSVTLGGRAAEAVTELVDTSPRSRDRSSPARSPMHPTPASVLLVAITCLNQVLHRPPW